MVEYEDILAARERIRDTIAYTPMVTDHALSERLGRPVRLKGELFQHTGAFKPRGALNWLRTASRDELEAGLVAVSAGNHAAALAWAARTVGAPVTVVMPEDASPIKVEATRGYGAEVILHGDVADAFERMHELVEERGLTLVHPFDDPRIIAGQGTVGLEILEQAPEASVVLCPVGGGGLISGVAVAVKHERPDTRIIGVEPEGAAAMLHAWNEGAPTPLDSVETCAKSLAPAITGEHTYEISRRYVDDIVTVSEEGIGRGVRHLLMSAKLYAEPGAAAGIATLLDETVLDQLPEDGDIVAIVSGGNMSFEELGSLT